MNITDHFPESLETVFWVKNTIKFFNKIRNLFDLDLGWKNSDLVWKNSDPGWKNSDPG